MVDDDHFPGQFTSIALDSAGFPHIAHYQQVYLAWFLKYARWDGSQWQLETISSLGKSGRGVALVLDAADRPHIAFRSQAEGWTLQYPRYVGAAQWDITVVDQIGEMGFGVSLTLDSTGRPHIAYQDQIREDLKYAVGPPVAAVALDSP